MRQLASRSTNARERGTTVRIEHVKLGEGRLCVGVLVEQLGPCGCQLRLERSEPAFSRIGKVCDVIVQAAEVVYAVLLERSYG